MRRELSSSNNAFIKLAKAILKLSFLLAEELSCRERESTYETYGLGTIDEEDDDGRKLREVDERGVNEKDVNCTMP